MTKSRFHGWVELIPGPNGTCPACEGTGSSWPRRKDGSRDRRYLTPNGPCASCNGTGGWIRRELGTLTKGNP